MKNILFFIAIVLLVSCSSQRYCQPSKRSKDWAVLKEGTISKEHERSTLVSIKKTMLGEKHLFVTDQGDTIYKTYQQRLCVGECYYVLKNI